MRIAVLADIHENLRAVQEDPGRHSADFVVSLGDNVSGPLQVAATADWLMQQEWAGSPVFRRQSCGR